jgi:maltooligosyltrehalose trehalohydrolase
MKIGAKYSQKQTSFVLWAPHQQNPSLVFPEYNQVLKMNKTENGYWHAVVKGIKPETKYLYRLDDQLERPDPASHFQPKGVFGPSAVIDHTSFVWEDDSWRGLCLEDMIICELHVGTFTRGGTFAAAKSKVAELKKIGINTVELMPVSQFSGERNWGYDAVLPFAVQNSYGKPDELKELIQEFHANGIAVILDVVYNHLGPEGNYVKDFGPYFLFDRKTPWGLAINFDGPMNEQVRNYFFENALHWFQNYHIDGLRLDAVYAIIDNSPKHFLKELSEIIETQRTKQKKLLLMAENDKVDPKIVGSKKLNGYGMDAVWHDNLHHSLHALLTGERNWYYGSFGTLRELREALSKGCADEITTNPLSALVNCLENTIPPEKLIVFSQNHDQIGNRPQGDRLITVAGVEAAKLAAGIILLSQFTPLLFMGEEHGEKAPFLFFTDFSDQKLSKNVRIGRKKELKQNGWKGKPSDPQNLKSFNSSKIDWQQRPSDESNKITNYYQELIHLRRKLVNRDPNKRRRFKFLLEKDESLLVIQKQTTESTVVTIANFAKEERDFQFPSDGGTYTKILDSADQIFLGPGSILTHTAKLGDRQTICPMSISVYSKLEGKK